MKPHSAVQTRGGCGVSERPWPTPASCPPVSGAPADFAAVREALRPPVAEWEAAMAAQVITDEATKKCLNE